MSGDVRRYQDIRKMQQIVFAGEARGQSSCDEDEGVNPHNPGGRGREGRGDVYKVTLRQSYRCFLFKLFVRQAESRLLSSLLPPGVRCEGGVGETGGRGWELFAGGLCLMLECRPRPETPHSSPLLLY